MSPQVAIPALITGVAKYATGAGLTAAFGAAATTAALAGVSYAINRRSMNNGGVLGSALTQTLKQPTTARRIIYGEARVSGVVAYMGNSNGDRYKHLVIMLAGHEVESISDIQLNGNPLEYYNKFGKKPAASVAWAKQGGTDVNLNNLSVTVNGQIHTGTIASIISALAARGFIVSGEGDDYEVKDGVFQASARLEITVENINDTLVVSAASSPSRITTNIANEVPVRVNVHLGAADQAADADLMLECPDDWTADHRLRGIAYLYIRLRYDYEAFPSGLPNVTALVQGKKDIYDPRDSSYGYTTNAALCCADYLAHPVYGLGAEYGAEIGTAALIAAANICDETITLADEVTTEPRYTCNGAIETSTSMQSGIESILSSMSGSAVYSGGVWVLRAGAYETPTLTLDEGDLRGAISLQTRQSRTNLCNGVKGVFTSPDNDYQPADFPPVLNATYLAEDGERIWKDIELAFTNSSSMAQRLAKMELEQSRQGMVLKYPCKLSAFGLTAGDTVMINNTRYGLSAKPFRVTDWEFALESDGSLGVDLLLRETASGVYDWNDGEETTVDLAPNTTLATPWFVGQVLNLALTAGQELNSDGITISTITVEFDEPETVWSRFTVELWNQDTGALWGVQEITQTSCKFTSVKAETIYLVRVVARTALGAYSQPVAGLVAVAAQTAVQDYVDGKAADAIDAANAYTDAARALAEATAAAYADGLVTAEEARAIADATAKANAAQAAAQTYTQGWSDEGADVTGDAIESNVDVVSGRLRIGSSTNYAEITAGDIRFMEGTVQRKALRRTDTGIQTNGTPVVFSPAGASVPVVLLQPKTMTVHSTAYASSDAYVEIYPDSLTAEGFTPVARFVVPTGVDETYNFTLNFASSAQTRVSVNTTIDEVVVTLDTVSRISDVQSGDGGSSIVYYQAIQIKIEYSIDGGSTWTTNYTGYVNTRASDDPNRTPFVRTISNINSGANNVRVRVTNLGSYQAAGDYTTSSPPSVGNTCTFTKLREIAEASEIIDCDVNWMAIW